MQLGRGYSGWCDKDRIKLYLRKEKAIYDNL